MASNPARDSTAGAPATGPADPRLRDANLVASSRGETTLGDLVRDARRRLDALPAGAPTVLLTEDDLEAVQAAAWLCATRRDGMVLPSERWTDALATRCREEGFSILNASSGRYVHTGDAEPCPGRVWLATSGTTGAPKLVAHTWATLYTAERAGPLPSLRWLLVYQPGTYAWYQVITLLCLAADQAAVVADSRQPADLFAAAARHGADAIAATPTFWRVAWLSADPDDLRALAPKRLSLGGEIVDQDVLDRLLDLYPGARLRHIYASTELGACIVVGDGRAGFPAGWLDDPERQPQLRVRDGRLQIHSEYAGLGYDGWVDTGDAVSVDGGRAYFGGRVGSAWINVGGSKAFVADIARVLLSHAGVLWCRVRGVKAPLTGELVAADVVLDPRHPMDRELEEELTRHCAAALPEAMVPRLWSRLSEIPSSNNFKSDSTNGEER